MPCPVLVYPVRFLPLYWPALILSMHCPAMPTFTMTLPWCYPCHCLSWPVCRCSLLLPQPCSSLSLACPAMPCSATHLLNLGRDVSIHSLNGPGPSPEPSHAMVLKLSLSCHALPSLPCPNIDLAMSYIEPDPGTALVPSFPTMPLPYQALIVSILPYLALFCPDSLPS